MKKFILSISASVLSICSFAQEKLAVLNFDVVGKSLTKEQFITITRSEISKLDQFQVLDKYTIQEALQEKTFNMDQCYGTNCLSEVGSQLKVKYVLAGAVEVINDKAIITLRMIDVAKVEAVKASYSEFLWSEGNAERLIELAVQKLFDRPIDPKMLQIYDYSAAKRGELEGPAIRKYNLSGPRFGASYLSGVNGKVFQASKQEGGFDKAPFMTVIGYQFEKQYLYTGPFQAVFQVNISVTGLDQQMAIPSLAILNGFRSTKTGWEFGFGPAFRIRRSESGFYAEDGTWKLESEAKPLENPDIIDRLDSRGDIQFFSSWIWAVGKSFKAGSMNIPINFYTIPDKDGWLFGLSMGYALHKN